MVRKHKVLIEEQDKSQRTKNIHDHQDFDSVCAVCNVFMPMCA